VISGLVRVNNWRRQTWLSLRARASSIGISLRLVSKQPGVREIGITFFTELAVLVTVFPVLETVIQNHGRIHVSWQMASTVIVIVLVSLILAVTIAKD
jgi:hypothetical protein